MSPSTGPPPSAVEGSGKTERHKWVPGTFRSLAAFAWLGEQTTLHGEVLPWKTLLRGFDLDGHKIPLVSMQGIFKPAVMTRWPLTLRTSAEGPYDQRCQALGSEDLRHVRLNSRVGRACVAGFKWHEVGEFQRS